MESEEMKSLCSLTVKVPSRTIDFGLSHGVTRSNKVDPSQERSSMSESEKAQHKLKDHTTSPGSDDFDLSAPIMEERRGSILGNVRVRILRPQHPAFRRVKDGVLEATDVSYKPEGRLASAL